MGNAYVYNDISSYNPNIEVTLVKDLDATVQCMQSSYSESNGTFSIIKNNETVFIETKTSTDSEDVSYTNFKLIAKAGDTIKFNLDLTDYAMCFLYLFEEKNYKEYKPKDFAVETIQNKVFTLENDLTSLIPPTGYEDFFKMVKPYDGFSCFVKVNYNADDFDNIFYFYIFDWWNNNYTAKCFGKAGDLYLFSYHGNEEWTAINLTTEYVSKTYVDENLGDIQTALDNIITMQNSLIGGNE